MRRHTETLEQKIARVLAEEIRVVPYDPEWPRRFEEEAAHLRSCLAAEFVRRIEHFGSTAVPGLCAKPVVDMLIEVDDLQRTRDVVAPILEAQGYDWFWRPTAGDDRPPFYAWFIKRHADGSRSHHLHMVERDFEHWERLRFRDALRAEPGLAADYAALKTRLAQEFPDDRVRYTEAKGDFIREATRRAAAEPGAGA